MRSTETVDRISIFGSGGRTRTCDLRVMSPTSCQLLHPAIVHTIVHFEIGPIETGQPVLSKRELRRYAIATSRSSGLIPFPRKERTHHSVSPMNRPVSRPISSTKWHSLNDRPHRTRPTDFSAATDELVDQSQ